MTPFERKTAVFHRKFDDEELSSLMTNFLKAVR
jgi:hypothetical protein